MSEKIIEMLDAIEAKQDAKIEEGKVEAVKKVEEAIVSFDEKVAALEAKLSSIQAPSVIKTYKTIGSEVNRMVKEQLKSFISSDAKVQKEIKMFESADQYDAYFKEASALTGGGAGVGGRTAYDPVFVPLRLLNPMRGIARGVATDGSTYQFRAKVGNAGAAWGYAIQNNGTPTTEDTNIWQLTLQDVNVQFPIRTAALDDIDGLEGNVVSDMMAEFSQTEALSMIQNNDQGATSLPYGGSNGLRGLDQYAGANATYAGGTISVAAFGTSGTGSTSGLHSIATYDQLTTNANTVGAANITYKDVVNFIYSLPQQYWTESAAFVISPILLQQIRGLVDSQGRPIYIDGLARNDGIVGTLLGFNVVVNKYLDTPSQTTTGAVGTNSLYPMYFADWQKAFTIVDRLNMVLRRYDQTLPGFITFFGEKRLATSIVDPNAIIRFRSTGTAT
ncbi:major_cap_HK97, phage major capsid protein, HK97 family [uncultured Caudovirales phage]|uniref:Major_cap_HK97, phage major capsid protein, HK97 family n=1 Tax=uncultured Caudovirales phage TaxID=2100421 RepID=A0A6J5KMN1_9CAUD|nr:major_cap_HK97, phage major capsid protein, HK97 family [uncultured Caudovirales phage]